MGAADGPDPVDLLLFLEQRIELVRDVFFGIVPAGPRRDKEPVADLLQLVLPVEEVAGLDVDEREHAVSGPLEGPGDGIDGRYPEAPAGTDHCPEILDIRGPAERADIDGQLHARLWQGQLLRAGADP